MQAQYFPTPLSTSLIESECVVNPSQLLQSPESFYSCKSETVWLRKNTELYHVVLNILRKLLRDGNFPGDYKNNEIPYFHTKLAKFMQNSQGQIF